MLADGLTDTDRAGVLYRVGLVRYKMGSLATAAAALDEAAKLAEGAIEPSDALRVRILNVRAKVRRRQKDFTAASEDVTQALELARSLNDDRVLAETLLDASLVAERQNQYSLARDYAERSKALYERVSDHEYVGKLLNNLGQLRAITGKPEEAVPLLTESFRIAVEQDNRVDAGFAASSLASAELHTRRLRRCHREWKSRDRVIGFSPGIPRRRRERSNRDRPRADGVGSHRRGRALVCGRRELFRGGRDGQSSGRLLGGTR